MERDERKCEHDQLAHNVPRSLVAFWDGQLERVKRSAESQAKETSTSSTSNGKFRLESGCSNGD